MTRNRISRRRFLASSAVATAPLFIPACAIHKVNNRPAPSGRIVLATIGCGGRGSGVTGTFLAQEDCQVVAGCDVDADHLDAFKKKVDAKYKNNDCKTYKDYREVIGRDDIDAVFIATPDHWHALVATAAANAGKDIFGEKPLARTIREQQAIVEAVQRNKRIWQTGSWQRSQFNFRQACELVRNGYIGKVKHVEVGLPSGHSLHMRSGQRPKGKLTPQQEAEWAAKEAAAMQPSTPPAALDYNFWTGPSALLPYVEGRIHWGWRWNYNTGGGQLLDWIGHHCDIAHWGLDYDNTGPVEVRGTGNFPPPDAVFNTATEYRVESRYATGVTMTIGGGQKDIRSGTKWIGENGWVWVDRSGFEASNKEWIKDIADREKNGNLKVTLYKSPGHERNFLDCVKSRQKTITPVEVAHHSAIPGHLGLIAMQTGRTIKWDPATEQIIGDADAAKRLGRNYRAPWKLA
jgi:predicted dehydrogenase